MQAYTPVEHDVKGEKTLEVLDNLRDFLKDLQCRSDDWFLCEMQHWAKMGYLRRLSVY